MERIMTQTEQKMKKYITLVGGKRTFLYIYVLCENRINVVYFAHFTPILVQK